MEHWKLTETAKYYTTIVELSGSQPNVQCVIMKSFNIVKVKWHFYCSQFWPGSLENTGMTLTDHKHNFILFADQLNWLGKWNTRATDTCLLSLERVTLLVSKCLWTENTCLQFISAAEQFKLLRFYQCPGHHVLSIN